MSLFQEPTDIDLFLEQEFEQQEIQKMLDLYYIMNTENVSMETYESMYLEYMELKGRYVN